MRRRISLKSNTCTEGVDVYTAGISGKVGAHYPGRSRRGPYVLLLSRGDGISGEKSAEGIVGSSAGPKAGT